MTTTTAVPSSDVSDFLYNVQALDSIVSSPSDTYVDRLGVQRLTATGATNRVAALNPRGPWATATLYQPRDLVLESGTWYVALDTHTSGATFAGDLSAHWRPEQGVTSSDLLDSSTNTKGAGKVGLGILSYPANTAGGALFTTVWAAGATDRAAQLTAANALGLPIRIVGACTVSSPVTITVPIVDTMAQIFQTTAQITIDNHLPVRPEWWGISNQNCVDLAIIALPSTGGSVLFESRVYPTSNYFYGFGGTGKSISKPNIKLIGRKMPTLTSDCKALTGGTILQGEVIIFADNIEVSDLGIDTGYTFTQTVLGGASNIGYCDGLALTYPNDASKNANELKNRAVLRNVIGLCAAPTTPAHAILVEGYKNVSLQGEVIGMYGVHGCAIKSSNLKADTISTYGNSTDGIIIKSDTQTTAISSDIQISKISTNAGGPSGLSPHLVATTGVGILFEAAGNNIGKVQIGSAQSFGHPIALGTLFGGNHSIDCVEIGQLTTDQVGVGSPIAALNLSSSTNQNIVRWRIDSAMLRNCGVAANFNFTQTANNPNHVSIGRLTVVNASDVAAQVAGSSWVDIGSVSAVNCSAGVYRMLGTPRLQVGSLTQAGTTPTSTYTNSSGGLQPSLANSWSQIASNDPFSVDLSGGRVCLRGLVAPGSSNIISVLPAWARPLTNKRFMVQGYNGTTVVSVPLIVSTSGSVTVNETTGGTANCSTWLSLSGVTYDQQA